MKPRRVKGTPARQAMNRRKSRYPKRRASKRKQNTQFTNYVLEEHPELLETERSFVQATKTH